MTKAMRPTGEHAEACRRAEHAEHAEHADHNNGHPPYITGDWYTLGQFGNLKLTIGYYIDTLTVTMFCMVTLIASCIHFYAIGYMHDELHDVTDHEVHARRRPSPAPPRPVPPLLPVPVAVLFQHAGHRASPATWRWCSCSGNWWASAPTS